jgi:predicted GIY-YIG superfamily endonuclease
MQFFVYVLRSTKNGLYIGQTNNLGDREHQQLTKSVKAAKFAKDGAEFRLVYSETYSTRTEAMKREKQLKGWSRAKKEALISGNLEKPKPVSKTRQQR